MSGIANYVLELLSEDMVSHGFLVQCVEQEDWTLGLLPAPRTVGESGHQSQLEWKAVLTELLSGDVEIGETRLASPDYVEFIAWKGKIKERVSRAVERVESLASRDREFAYWLALRKNVDRFEGEEV